MGLVVLLKWISSANIKELTMVMLLTAGSLAQHLDASLCVALGFLQLALVGIGGWIRTAHRGHQRRTVHPLANALCLGRVGWITLTYGAEAAQHPPATCQRGRRKGGGVRCHVFIGMKYLRRHKFMLTYSLHVGRPNIDECKHNLRCNTRQVCLNTLISICMSHWGLGAELYTVQQRWYEANRCSLFI